MATGCWLVLGLLVMGCREGSNGSPSGHWDSAGVAITSLDTDLTGLPMWSLDSPPVTEIGRDFTEAGWFRGLEGARRLRDGSIVLSSDRPAVARLFDSTGRFVRIVTTNGSGPGELLLPMGPFRLGGDSSYLLDGGRQPRAVLLGPSAEILATIRLPSRTLLNSANLSVMLASVQDAIMGDRGHPPCEGSPCHDSIAIIRLRGEQSIDTVTWIVGKEEFGSGRDVLLGARPVATVTTGGVWVADARKPAIFFYDVDGKLLRTIRWKARGISYTDRDLANIPADVRATLPIAKVAPEISNVLIADNGDLWIERRIYPWKNTTPYMILDSVGNPRGSIELPNVSWILQAQEDHLMVLWREEETGLELVRVFRLVRRQR